MRLAVLALALAVFAPCAARASDVPLQWSTWNTSAVANDRGYPVFTVDGKPFFVYGAAFFYERIPRSQWLPALQTYRIMGINTIDLYVIWNWHEPSDGVRDFTGKTNPRRDLLGLLQLTHQLGFKVILRPGPVIRNEWRNGGYPAWLLERPEYWNRGRLPFGSSLSMPAKHDRRLVRPEREDVRASVDHFRDLEDILASIGPHRAFTPDGRKKEDATSNDCVPIFRDGHLRDQELVSRLMGKGPSTLRQRAPMTNNVWAIVMTLPFRVKDQSAIDAPEETPIFRRHPAWSGPVKSIIDKV